MGLIAIYNCLSDADLKELKAMGSAEEEIKDKILHDFEQMKRFYKQVLEANGHVHVLIC